jgi:hypothetical protein
VGRGRLGRGLVHGLDGRGDRVDLLAHLGVDGSQYRRRVVALVRQLAAQPDERFALLGLFGILARPVLLDVAVVMAAEADGLALQEDRPAARPGLGGSPGRSVEDRLGIAAVDDLGRDAVAGDAVHQVPGPQEGGGGRQLRPAVVLTHDDERQVLGRREHQALVQRALAHRPVADGHDDDPAAPLVLGRHGDAVGSLVPCLRQSVILEMTTCPESEDNFI